MGGTQSSGRTRSTSSFSDSLNGSSDFGYEEFGGRDGKTCPTCHGTGRISRTQSEELVALIPYNDKRLKPRRTSMYVILAVIGCLIVCGLILFFILPRSVKITEKDIANYTVKLDSNTSSTIIIVTNQFNITNTNYFHIKVVDLSVSAYFDEIGVGNGELKNTPIYVPAKTSGFVVNVTFPLRFTIDNKLDYVIQLCDGSTKMSHDVAIVFQATLTSEYMSHSEQGTLRAIKFIDCSKNTVVNGSNRKII